VEAGHAAPRANGPEPALAPSKENARAPSVPVTTGISRQSEPEVIAGLMARANALLRRGDIGSARIVLERAAEAGNAEASFRLAETYDPVVLSKWGTFGTRGDAMKALDLYARARAGGIMEAKERLDALRP
jgi:TPR repeat protein